jgi:hypothetical protein
VRMKVNRELTYTKPIDSTNREINARENKIKMKKKVHRTYYVVERIQNPRDHISEGWPGYEYNGGAGVADGLRRSTE